MAYEPYYPEGWKDSSTGGTAITADALNHIEQGITDLESAISLLAQEVAALRTIANNYENVKSALAVVTGWNPSSAQLDLTVGVS